MNGDPPGAWRRVWRDPRGRAGLIILGLLLVTAIAGPWFLPDPRVQPDVAHGALLPPGPGHLLGTDHLSRDVLSRLVSGGRVSLAVAVGAVFLSVTMGALVGTVAGYAGGWVDGLLMRLVDAALAIPRLFLLLLMVAVMEHLPLTVLILTLGITGWFGTSRLVRAEVIRLRTLDFVRSAEALGASRRRVILRHLLPNVVGPLAAATTLAVGDVILLEAGLSFLGLGVQPPTPSWGGMILDGQSYLATAPWTSLAPGVAIVIVVLAVNLVGEAMHHATLPDMA
ncbi:MAG TPA: ABC transporter permease [Gemmatimonadales bacterium]|nr:ABC transporter permease [Gemmatimonadales bacterium]